MKLSPPIRFKDRYAQVSDLRWAFLVCTAYFGYSFARSSALNDVRKQILNPDEIIVPQWYVDAPKMENSKIYLCENEGVVAVKYRGQSVVLPWSHHTKNNIPVLIEKGINNMTFRRFSWPTSFHAYIDLGEGQRAT